jgi:ABC-type enterochelin transport system substrate-binding protein
LFWVPVINDVSRRDSLQKLMNSCAAKGKENGELDREKLARTEGDVINVSSNSSSSEEDVVASNAPTMDVGTKPQNQTRAMGGLDREKLARTEDDVIIISDGEHKDASENSANSAVKFQHFYETNSDLFNFDSGNSDDGEYKSASEDGVSSDQEVTAISIRRQRKKRSRIIY